MERNFISFEEARELVKEYAKPLGEVIEDVEKSLGMVISQDIFFSGRHTSIYKFSYGWVCDKYRNSEIISGEIKNCGRGKSR
jgi:aromatic ring-opening dioxygenase LigB subunit